MSIKAFEDKLQKLSAQHIYQETLADYLLLLLSMAEDETQQRNQLSLEVNPEILEIKKEIQRYVVQIEELLNGDDVERLQAMDSCIALKSKLLQKYEAVYAYFLLWNVFAMPVGDEVVLRKHREEHAVKNEGVRWELFVQDCEDYLQSAENNQEEQKRISNLLQCIPIKMGRDKYFDTLKKSLITAFEHESEESIAAVIRAFDGFCAPELQADYGKFFPEISEWILARKLILPSELSDEVLDLEYEEFQETYQTLTEIEDYFSSIYNDINALILLFSQSYTFEELTENDASYSDLYHAIVECISGEVRNEEKEAVLDTAGDILGDAVGLVIDQALATRKKKSALLDKITDFNSLSEESQKILLTEEFVTNCYYGELNDELFHFGIEEDLPEADESYKNKVFDTFLEKVRSYFAKLPLSFRRGAMRRLLSALPQAITATELLEMMEEALETAPNFEAKLLILDKVGALFQDEGFDGNYNHGEEMEFEHDHEHDCGCGHDHHHHH